MGAANGNNPTENEVIEASWSTGDPEKDWSRFDRQFDQIDRGLRHRLSCLLAFNALLLMGVAMAGYGNATVLWPMVVVVMFWGFAVSLAIYWAQYRAVASRRIFSSRWEAEYPQVFPAPGGAEFSPPGRVSSEPHVLIPLTSVAVWLVMIAYYIGEPWSPLNTRDLSRVTGILAGIVIVIALLKFVDRWAAFRESIDPERNPRRKW